MSDITASFPSSPITQFPGSKSEDQLGSDPFTGSHSVFDNIIREYDNLKLSPDFAKRPLYVCPDGHVFLETFSPFYKPAYDFIISIAEPISRPKYIQEYQISSYSLYTAVSIGLTAEEIISVLSLFSKVELSDVLKQLIKGTIQTIGKLKLILKNKRYFVQSTDIGLLRYIARKLESFRVTEKNEEDVIEEETGFIIPDLEEEAKNANAGMSSFINSLEELGYGIDFDNEDDFFDDAVENEFENHGDPFSISDHTKTNNLIKLNEEEMSKKASNKFLDSDIESDIESETNETLEESKNLPTSNPTSNFLQKNPEEDKNDTQDLTKRSKVLNLESVSILTDSLQKKKLKFSSMNGVTDKVRRFEIRKDSLREVRKVALSLNIPFSDEYDFRSDVSNPNLEIDIRKTTTIRSYQEKALSKMFGGSRAKSGIIVLPCGAGKTLVGITACCTIRKSTIIFCDSNISVDQWVDQLKRYANIAPKDIYVFNSESKVNIPDVKKPCVLVTTYSINISGRSRIVQDAMKKIYEKEWGLMIMDEVQSLVTETFSTVIDKINAHTKLGLTATLVREDDKIINLNYLVGPRLYEANWIDLSDQGFIARVKCYEIWCKMTGDFYKEYLKKENGYDKKRNLSSLNPNKFNAVERLIRYHESRGDKILVFADILNVLAIYGTKLRKSQFGNHVRPVLSGSTSYDDRQKIFSEFKNSNRINCIFISRIGDKAIDLPDANVLIQISSHFGSRMQEAQRLGRILRKKPGKSADYNAFFYTIISEDTNELYYSTKRRRFLTDQGYVFEVVSQSDEAFENRWPLSSRGQPLLYESKEKQKELLKEALRDIGAPDETQNEDVQDILEDKNDKTENKEEEQKVVSIRSFNPFGDINTQFSNI